MWPECIYTVTYIDRQCDHIKTSAFDIHIWNQATVIAIRIQKNYTLELADIFLATSLKTLLSVLYLFCRYSYLALQMSYLGGLQVFWRQWPSAMMHLTSLVWCHYTNHTCPFRTGTLLPEYKLLSVWL